LVYNIFMLEFFRPGDEVAELLSEISQKQRETPGASLKAVAQALARDAAMTCAALATFDRVTPGWIFYPHRCFKSAECYQRQYAHFANLVSAIETPDKVGTNFRALIAAAGYQPKDMPSATMARRLRVVTGAMPRLLPPPKSKGIGSDSAKVWDLLWREARGDMAPKIAEALRPEFVWVDWLSDSENLAQRAEHERDNLPVKRNQIWRLRDWAYDGIVANVERLQAQQAAAA
jgi:hypothetical protein